MEENKLNTEEKEIIRKIIMEAYDLRPSESREVIDIILNGINITVNEMRARNE